MRRVFGFKAFYSRRSFARLVNESFESHAKSEGANQWVTASPNSL